MIDREIILTENRIGSPSASHTRKISSHRLLNSSTAGSVEASYLAAVVHPIHNFTMTATDALLLQESQTLEKLYDAECIMSISATVAQGYLVLLGGVEEPGKTPATATATATANNEVSLAFMALAHGNVLDACFGVQNASRRQDTPAFRAAREAKQMIEEHGTSDTFRLVAVQAYANAFRAVIAYRNKYDKLNCITRCFRTKKLQAKCEKDLREAFWKLAKSVAEQR